MTDKPASRWSIFKKLVIFQVKLAFDALRDLFLSPISFGCALIDIIKNNPDEQSYFKKLMTFGGKTDLWLNLFSQHDYTPDDANKSEERTISGRESDENLQKNADQLFDKIEDLIREQSAKGGLTTSAKSTLDGVLQKLANHPVSKISEKGKAD
ncbi:hypothetical protein [Thalassotalea castellviae]|uniref:Uncharacterized protein n=1 Tax=Thalassotalea castellviae TaxID=3075612 RepID=A0ABU2ZYB5_9GAMM|nr:hypothetical protein [Thalassotalea sp. W431]MDT0602918.1 hypothetical protein [Thalassotalea sp. W431]